jgi:hypothetical protein
MEAALDDDAKLGALPAGMADESKSFRDEATLDDLGVRELPLFRPQDRDGFFLSSGLDATADSEATDRSCASLSSAAVPVSCSFSEWTPSR